MTCLCRAGWSSRTWLQKAGSCSLAYRQAVAGFAVLLLHPLLSVPLKASSQAHQEEGDVIKERGIRLRGFIRNIFFFFYEKYSIFARLNEESSCSLNPSYLTGLPTDSKCLFALSQRAL